jgi:hypothetical protein
VNHLNPDQNDTSAPGGLEAEHRPGPPLDSPMILLDPVIRIAALADPDRFHLAPRPVLQPGCRREALVPKEKLCLVNSAGVQLETHLALPPIGLS